MLSISPAQQQLQILFKHINSNNIEKVKEVIEDNPQIVNKQDNELQTPLFYASSRLKKEIVDYIV